ncbi:diaminopimelate epimerase [Actinophytocola xanthii]|uniref:Diaminopimelate epimerase n=1 Tax=Actinophytocola xanthii TaxID=1912961 RepID=A0A1Q8CR93_9PSEU|nr:diaminopimelate epimerase [Actinophytocola xanthii]OLF16878.1 diaminopimelate epimerase [Actinophytocola xanthii]
MHISFLKGHGTENDFVLLPDVDAVLDLTPARVRALCDRRAGLGADGVLRVVRAKAVEGRPGDVDDDMWFMDYRNADGSVAEMCGNGLRVFARYLLDSGLVGEREFPVGTRAGVRAVRVDGNGEVAIDMGAARVGADSSVTTGGRRFAGVAVDVGNPHLVCIVDSLDDLDLSVPPTHDRELFPDGVNVEFVVVDGPERIRMRVHERGVGETRSCGTGTVAAVAGVLHARGETSGAADVHVPGGCVHVAISGKTSTLTGPAAFVARGEVDLTWWNALAERAE